LLLNAKFETTMRRTRPTLERLARPTLTKKLKMKVTVGSLAWAYKYHLSSSISALLPIGLAEATI
jgi:hypothetical protein